MVVPFWVKSKIEEVRSEGLSIFVSLIHKSKVMDVCADNLPGPLTVAV